MKIACSGITWDSFARDRGLSAATTEDILAEIAQLGYAGAPVNLAKPVEATAALFTQYGLAPAPGYFSADFWDAAQQTAILERAEEAAQRSEAFGCTELFVAADGFGWVTPCGQTRSERTGRIRAEDGLDDDAMQQFAAMLDRVGEITLAHGVSSCFHNHVGSLIETRQEIDRLFALVDPALVFQGPDLGHLAWAGDDVLDFLRTYGARMRSLHIKDYDATVRTQGIAAGWDYAGFTNHGLWTEIGQGAIDWSAVFALLAEGDYAGWVIIETDVTQRTSPFESALVSRDHLQRPGVWE